MPVKGLAKEVKVADRPSAKIEETGHAPDKSEATGAHWVHCADHHARLTAVEMHLGMAAQPGVAAEETASRATQTETKKEASRARKRH